MQLARLALVLAATATGALASSAPDIINDIRAGLYNPGGPLLMPRQNKNLQTFTGALGGIKAEAVTETNDATRPFEVGSDTFTDFASAAGRSCDNQKNSCATMANSGGQTFTVSDCDTQNTQCKASIKNESVNVSAANSGSSSTSTTSSTTTTSSSSLSTTTTSSSSTSTTSSTSSTTTTSLDSLTSTTLLSTSILTSATSTTSSASVALVSSNSQFNFFCEV